MAKIRRGGLVVLARRGDHSPRHVRVYQDGRLVTKWDLETHQSMLGRPSRRVRRILVE